MLINEKEILVFKDIEEIADHALERWAEIADKETREKNSFSVALSGGTTPAALFGKLALRKDLPWNRTHIFMVDERFVPYDDNKNNYRMINDTLLRHVDIPAENIHPILTADGDPGSSAEKYEKELSAFSGPAPCFDLILLGIGSDGHTASLFPGAHSLKESSRLAIAVPPAGPIGAERITLTYPVINAARNILFMAAGKDKAPAISEVVTEKGSLLPAAMVTPEKCRPVFLLDKGAASLI